MKNKIIFIALLISSIFLFFNEASAKMIGYYVNVTFEGFRVEFNGRELPKTVEEKNDNYNVFDNLIKSNDWKMKNLKIVRLIPDELQYDREKGVAIGKIIAKSTYKGATETFTIPFQFAAEGYTVDVYSDNPYLGTVSDSLTGKFEGQSVTVSATEKVEGAFKYWYERTADGSNPIVSHDKDYTFTMPNRNRVLVAHFEYDVETHKLWVTSNNTEWGETWTYDNNNEKTTYVADAVIDKKYDLRYNAASGYKFVRWEYRPYFDNDFEKNGQIKMPDHDITVTAIFEKEDKDLEELGDKNLIITVNNPEWGRAGIIPDPASELENAIDNAIPRIDNAIPGKEYFICEQANDGYYFTGWIYSPTYLDNPLTLNSSIIMPEKTVTVTAFFSPIQDMYEVKTKVEPEEGGEIIGNIPAEAAPGQKFEVSIKENEGFVFDYWYYIDPDGNKVIISKDPTTIIAMPAHKIELVAVFKEVGKYNLYVTSNNPEWGEAWTTPDDSDEKVWERIAIEGKEYSINALPNTGYEFVEFVYKPEMENPLEGEGKIKMPSHDITVTAIFRESAPEIKDDPTLYISVNNPKWGKAWIVDKDGDKHYASSDPMGEPNRFVAESGETYDIFYEAKNGYKFVGWYTSPDIGLGDFAEDITMPSQNLTLTAFFSIDTQTYALIVKSEPNEGGETYGSVEEAYYGREYPVEAVPEEGWKLDYWYYYDENNVKVIVSREEEFDFEMPNYDVELFAKFKEKSSGDGDDNDNDGDDDYDPIMPSDPIPPEDIPTPSTNSGKATSFIVTSVRDLRWKDHFVDKYGNYISANALNIPSRDDVIVKYTGYPTELKMGYAVEFEMKTIMVSERNAKLIIKPEIYIGNRRKASDFDEIIDDASGKTLDELGNYSEIVISGRDRDITDSFQTKAIATYPKPKNNDVEYDEITWSWVYYLPAQLSEKTNRRSKPITEDVTVKFNIELHDTSTRRDLTALDYVNYIEVLNKNNHKNNHNNDYWKGKVFKYSGKDSLLDDIYDNATN